MSDVNQQIANASLDLKTIEDFVNLPADSEVYPRLLPTVDVGTLAGIRDAIFEAGGLPATPFTTKALMESSELVDGDYAMVTDDTANDGLYVKTAGVWVKSAYDPLGQAESKIDDLIVKTTSPNIYEVQDVDGTTVATIDNRGKLNLAGMTEPVQDAIKAVSGFAAYTDSENLAEIKDKDGSLVAFIDKNGEVAVAGIKGSLQQYLKKLGAGLESNNAVIVEGKSAIGKALYAELPDGVIGSSYSWYADGQQIAGADKSYYVLSQGDLYKNITAKVNTVSGAETQFDSSGVTIGGVALEQAGAVGSLYEGYVLSAGDDFTELDIIAPHKPLGRWFTTRSYLAGARGSDSLLGTMYDTDPYHLGYNDSNRGVPVGYDNMSQKGSVLTLNARAANKYEKAHMQGTRNEVASMINSIGAFSMYAGTAGGGENILEWRVRHTLAERNPKGWHPSLWTQSSLPAMTYNSNEWDISEGTAKYSTTNYNEWGADGLGAGGNGYGKTMSIMDGKWHLVSAIFSHTGVDIYLDNVLIKSIIKDANSFNEPAYALISNHVFSGSFDGERYSKSEWDARTKGATIDVDFIRLWRKASKSHIKPLAVVSPVNIAYGATGTITLPSKMELWGRTDVLEHVQTIMTEENEPAGHHTRSYDSLPAMVQYSDTTRTATINTAGQKSGRLNFVIYGYLQDGSTCEPARTYANVAPRIDIANISMTNNASYDVYARCDCGVLVTDGVKRTKVIDVTGLPLGASYNDNTGFIYSNDAALGTYSLQVTCINSVGQSTAKNVNLIIS